MGQGWQGAEWTLGALETTPGGGGRGQRGPQIQQEPGVRVRGLVPASWVTLGLTARRQEAERGS